MPQVSNFHNCIIDHRYYLFSSCMNSFKCYLHLKYAYFGLHLHLYSFIYKNKLLLPDWYHTWHSDYIWQQNWPSVLSLEDCSLNKTSFNKLLVQHFVLMTWSVFRTIISRTMTNYYLVALHDQLIIGNLSWPIITLSLYMTNYYLVANNVLLITDLLRCHNFSLKLNPDQVEYKSKGLTIRVCRASYNAVTTA